MEDLIFEGFLHALVTLGVMQIVSSFVEDIDINKILSSSVWHRLLIVVYWLGCMLFASIAISGFLNFSKPDFKTTSFLFVFMIGVGLYKLNKK